MPYADRLKVLLNRRSLTDTAVSMKHEETCVRTAQVKTLFARKLFTAPFIQRWAIVIRLMRFLSTIN